MVQNNGAGQRDAVALSSVYALLSLLFSGAIINVSEAGLAVNALAASLPATYAHKVWEPWLISAAEPVPLAIALARPFGLLGLVSLLIALAIHLVKRREM